MSKVDISNFNLDMMWDYIFNDYLMINLINRFIENNYCSLILFHAKQLG
jgi:hypothetical protein